MSALSRAARAAIREAGFTLAEWTRMWGYASGTWSYASGTWGGDACGCFDDRCIGHHHEGADGCGCLESMLDDAVAWRQAASYPNSVSLAAPYGLFRYVSVSTPGVLAVVSATAGGFRPDAHEESVVRIEPREGWTAVVTEEDGKITVRLVRAAAAPETAGAR